MSFLFPPEGGTPNVLYFVDVMDVMDVVDNYPWVNVLMSLKFLCPYAYGLSLRINGRTPFLFAGRGVFWGAACAVVFS